MRWKFRENRLSRFCATFKQTGEQTGKDSTKLDRMVFVNGETKNTGAKKEGQNLTQIELCFIFIDSFFMLKIIIPRLISYG